MTAIRAAALLFLFAVTPAVAQNGGDLLLSGVTIVDTRDGRLLQDRTIHINRGRIVEIAAPGQPASSVTAQRVDARGKFVVPGYLDMHNHPLMAPDVRAALVLMLANGVTGFRQMASTPQLLAMRRAGQLPLSNQTPELLIMPGAPLARNNAGTPEAATAEVRRQKEMGADFIKIVDVPSDVFYATLAEARKLGLPVAGHLTANIDIAEAVKSGMRAIEHMGPRDAVLLGCSSAEADLRAEIARQKAPSPSAFGGDRALAERTLARALANPIVLTPPGEFERYRRVVESYDESNCRKLAALLAGAGHWQVPTLTRVRTMMFGDDAAYRTDPNLRYMPAETRKMWEEIATQFPGRVPPPAAATLSRLFDLQKKVVKLFAAEGVPMLAGTDGGQWMVPGFVLHQEFELLAEAGLSPLSILQMATLNGAKFLGREATMGTVEVGRDANLVLLDANPVDDVRNLHAIHAVVRAGFHYSATDLQRMKESAAVRQSATPSSP